MGFVVNSNTNIVVEDSALPGVKRIAGYVAADFEKIFGSKPSIKASVDGESCVVALTIGKSDILTKLVEEKKVMIDDILSLREVYRLVVIENNLYVIGSDKRGTIYGLFKISEMLGVSPFVNWGDVAPETADEITIEDDELITSKEPSVKYRGFFINDEWPAFGNWSETRFGGFNAECYEKVFELLLRLKGNYLWPAMWSAQFNLDGPGLENARLADEMGVIMGMSHHEPCCRNGEEYRYVRGEGSIYGDDWNFVRNREGITKFWEDGLKRNAAFENVITVGMRGEADSTILAHEATLKDNIDYLRDVLTTQEKLIAEFVNENVCEVPRMLALYKEVEPFFYGDETTPGLMGAKELDGVTLMLCDDNFGNLRTIPNEEMKNHKGGYGMYYHFDYHGSPISYEWVNTSYLPKVWEQMTTAYENGIQELWIVNVGDIFSTEFPLSFFLDMAYDYDRWGVSNIDAAAEYTKKFVDIVFPGWNDDAKQAVYEMLRDYTYLSHCRRTETLNADVIISNDAGRDRDEWYNSVIDLMNKCEAFREACPHKDSFRFFEFVYYPLMANMNIQKMWLLAAKNKYLASINAVEANAFETQIDACLEYDRVLVDELHTLNGGFWYGMGMSEHIGFAYWNEEECKYPVVNRVYETAKSRVIAVIPETLDYTEGSIWTGHPLVMQSNIIELLPTTKKDTPFSIEVKSDFIHVSQAAGVLTDGKRTTLEAWVDENYTGTKEYGQFIIKWELGDINVMVPTTTLLNSIDILADEYVSLIDGTDTKIKSIPEYGIYKSGIKQFPLDVNPADRVGETDFAPSRALYEFEAPKDGTYKISIYMSPSNPPFTDNKLMIGVAVNAEEMKYVNTVPDDFKVGDNQMYWSKGVLDNIRTYETTAELKKGANSLELSALSIGIVFEKIRIQLT